MNPADNNKPLLPYVRVSKTNGRKGQDSYISPDVQLESIERYANAYGFVLAEPVIEEDVSGGKAASERRLGELIEQCERGEASGIIVWRLSRFGRSALDVVRNADRLTTVGARLIAVEDGIDTGAKGAKLALYLFSVLAEIERDNRKEGWGAAVAKAAADGVHLGRTPPGYKRENDKRSRLVPDLATREIVREVFLRRADGASWKQLAEYLSEHGIDRSPSGVSGMVASRTYLGEVHGPQGVANENAHEALVSVEEWQAAQGARGPKPEHTGRFGSQALVGGQIRCGGCGGRLAVTGAGKGEKRRAVYYCRRNQTHVCPGPASAVASYVDAYVRDAFAVALFDGTLETTVDAAARYANAEQAVRKAQADLDALTEQAPQLLAAFGAERLAKIAEEQKAVLDEAEGALREAVRPEQIEVPDADLFGEYWPIERQREFARQYIARISLRKASEKGRGAEPVSERIEVSWAGHDEPDETLAERVGELRAKIPEALWEKVSA